jgi:hypothetical protein
MKVTRLDLDGTGSPVGLVTRILKIEKDLPIPVPIEELARQLDIEEIAPRWKRKALKAHCLLTKTDQKALS